MNRIERRKSHGRNKTGGGKGRRSGLTSKRIQAQREDRNDKPYTELDRKRTNRTESIDEIKCKFQYSLTKIFQIMIWITGIVYFEIDPSYICDNIKTREESSSQHKCERSGIHHLATDREGESTSCLILIPMHQYRFVGKNRRVKTRQRNDQDLKELANGNLKMSQISAQIQYLSNILGLKHLRYKNRLKAEALWLFLWKWLRKQDMFIFCHEKTWYMVIAPLSCASFAIEICFNQTVMKGEFIPCLFPLFPLVCTDHLDTCCCWQFSLWHSHSILSITKLKNYIARSSSMHNSREHKNVEFNRVFRFKKKSPSGNDGNKEIVPTRKQLKKIEINQLLDAKSFENREYSSGKEHIDDKTNDEDQIKPRLTCITLGQKIDGWNSLTLSDELFDKDIDSKPAGFKYPDRPGDLEIMLHPQFLVHPRNDVLCPFTYPVFDVSIHSLMRYEILRIRSYNKNSTMTYSVTQLAQHGFYYTGEGEEVICFNCGESHQRFLSGLSLDESAHLENCERGRVLNNVPLFKGTNGLTSSDLMRFNRKYGSYVDSGKSFIQQDPSASGENHVYFLYTSAASEPPVGTRPNAKFWRIYDEKNNFSEDEDFLNLRGAAYPLFANQRTRRETFHSWDPTHSQKPDDLVNLGFFYAGYSDCARCFYCGLGLKYWRPNDDAAYQHARFRPQCKYNQFVKGQAFIDQVQRNIAAENQGASASGDNIEVPNLDQLIKSDAARRVLEEGWGRQEVRAAVAKLVHDLGEECLIYDILMEILINKHKEATNQTDESSAPRGFPTATTRDVKDVHDGDGNIPDTIVEIGDTHLSQVDIDNSNTDSSGNSTGAEVSLDSDVMVRLLEREHNYRKKRMNCMVCGNNKIGCIYLPCGHVVACQRCGDLASTCVLCQKVISAIANIYLS